MLAGGENESRPQSSTGGGSGDEGDVEASHTMATRLQKMHRGNAGRGKAARKAVTGAIEKMKKGLGTLELRRAHLLAKDCEELAQELKQNASVKLLNMAHNRIGDEGAVALAAALGANGNRSLLKLHVQDNKIGDVGAKALAEAVALADAAVEELLIGENTFGEPGFQAFAEAVRTRPRLVIEHSLQNALAGEVKAVSAFSEALQAHLQKDHEQQVLFAAAAKALGAVANEDLREEMIQKQREVYNANRECETERCEAVFQGLQEKAATERKRLEGLVDRCVAKYRSVEKRWAPLEGVKAFSTPKALHAVGKAYEEAAKAEDFEAQVDLLLLDAHWLTPAFKDRMESLAQAFNSAEDEAEICESFGLDPEDWPIPFRAEHLPLRTRRVRPRPTLPTASPRGSAKGARKKPAAPNFEVVQGSGKSAVTSLRAGGGGRKPDVVRVHFGPPKSRERFLEKAKAEVGNKDGAGARGVWDLLRVTFEFGDPYVLAMFMAVMARDFGSDLVRVKNKFAEREEGPPDLHVNLRIGGHIAEVQLTLGDFLEIKKSMHKYYELERASSFQQVRYCVFNLLH